MIYINAMEQVSNFLDSYQVQHKNDKDKFELTHQFKKKLLTDFSRQDEISLLILDLFENQEFNTMIDYAVRSIEFFRIHGIELSQQRKTKLVYDAVLHYEQLLELEQFNPNLKGVYS